MKTCLLILFFAFTVIACNEKVNETKKNSSDKVEVNLDKNLPENITVTCQGSSCERGECTHVMVSSNNTAYCSCEENCDVVINYYDDTGNEVKPIIGIAAHKVIERIFSKKENTLFYSEFNNYASDLCGEKNYTQSAANIVFRENKGIAVQYKFANRSSNEKHSVVFLRKFNKGGVEPGGWNDVTIKCSGACDQIDQKCLENINAQSLDITCTCEGECKMEVTQ